MTLTSTLNKVYAFGIVILEMATFAQPYAEHKRFAAMARAKTNYVTPDCLELVTQDTRLVLNVLCSSVFVISDLSTSAALMFPIACTLKHYTVETLHI